MSSSSIRPTPVMLGTSLILLLLAACTGGGAKTEAEKAQAPNAAAFLPLGGNDLEVPDNVRPPPGCRPRPTRRGRAPVTPEARQPEVRPDPRLTRQNPPAQRPQVSPPPRALDRSGPQIRVTWEALAVEKDRLANPRIRRSQMIGSLAAQQKVVLVNQGHVEAQTAMSGVSSRQNRGVAVAAIPDRDMDLFIRSLEQRGFFRIAQPTGAIQSRFQDENARGRVTIEKNGRSWTLISMRGQGLNPQTKCIPPLYSEAKQSVMMLRNQVQCMGVVGVRGAVLTR